MPKESEMLVLLSYLYTCQNSFNFIIHDLMSLYNNFYKFYDKVFHKIQCNNKTI